MPKQWHLDPLSNSVWNRANLIKQSKVGKNLIKSSNGAVTVIGKKEATQSIPAITNEAIDIKRVYLWQDILIARIILYIPKSFNKSKLFWYKSSSSFSLHEIELVQGTERERKKKKTSWYLLWLLWNSGKTYEWRLNTCLPLKTQGGFPYPPVIESVSSAFI